MSTTYRTTRHALLVITLGLCGCAATGLQDPPKDITSVHPDSAIVIFSIVAERPVVEQSLKLSWVGANGKVQFGHIKQKPSVSPLRVFAVQVPGDRLNLLAIEMRLGGEWWQTIGRKELELVTGQVSYVGRIEIQEIRYYDALQAESSEALRPRSITLGFSDRSDSDIAALRAEGRLIDERVVVNQIPQEWVVNTLVALHPTKKVRSSNGSSGAGMILLELLGAILSGAPPIGL